MDNALLLTVTPITFGPPVSLMNTATPPTSSASSKHVMLTLTAEVDFATQSTQNVLRAMPEHLAALVMLAREILPVLKLLAPRTQTAPTLLPSATPCTANAKSRLAKVHLLAEQASATPLTMFAHYVVPMPVVIQTTLAKATTLALQLLVPPIADVPTLLNTAIPCMVSVKLRPVPLHQNADQMRAILWLECAQTVTQPTQLALMVTHAKKITLAS